MSDKVTVVLRKSLIGRDKRLVKTLRALGLRKTGAARVHQLTPSVKGMIDKVQHLVDVDTKK